MAKHKADLRFLSRAAQDVLYRSLGTAEMERWLGAEAEGVVRALYGQRAAMEIWLEEELYFFLLLDNFRPRNESVEDIPRRLHNGSLHVRDAVAEIMLSTGFNLRNPGNDTFVTVVLEQGLGMRVQDRRNVKVLEAGKKIYDGQKTRFLGGVCTTQADIIKTVIGKRQFIATMLDRHHHRLFGAPLAEDRRSDVDRVYEDPRQFFAVLGDWILSDAYREALDERRKKSDHQFVRGLYMDLLERLPRYQELRNMRNAMLSMADPAPLRAVMVKLILDSGRAHLPRLEKDREREFVATCFQRFLYRDPTQGESTVFTAALRDGGARPVHIVRSLVSSLEYQYY